MKFLEKFNNEKNIRFSSFKKVFEIFIKRNLKIIVETGTARGKTKFFFIKRYNWKDGMSTPMFAEYAKFINGTLHTCDISSENIENAKKFTSNFSDHIRFYIKDSLVFLKEFNNPIDLLYLDSLDGHDPIAASGHQLNEAKIAVNTFNTIKNKKIFKFVSEFKGIIKITNIDAYYFCLLSHHKFPIQNLKYPL